MELRKKLTSIAIFSSLLSYTTLAFANCPNPGGLQHVALYDGSLGASQEFVNIHEGAAVRVNGGCSGTYLPGNRVLTAGHCISNPNDVSNQTVDFNYQLGPDSNLESPLHTYSILSVEEYYLGGLDYAILQIDPIAAEKHPVARLSHKIPQTSSPLISISHSGGNPKRVGAGAFNWYNIGGWYEVVNLGIEGGASGSGLLDNRGYVFSTIAGTGCSGSLFAAGGVSIRKLLEYSPALNQIFNDYANEYAAGHINTFQDGIQWTNAGAVDWTINVGPTSSSGTGPNSGDGKYLFMETSYGFANNTGDEAVIISHPFIINDQNQNAFSFDYHMFGSNTGTLKAEIYDGYSWIELWSRSGQQHSSGSDGWSHANIDLSLFQGVVKVRLRAIAAGGYQGDIAIDNIRIPDFSYALDGLTDGHSYIRSAWPNAAGHGIHIENGVPETSVAPAGWLSSQWSFKVIAGKYVKITNRWQPNVSLHTEYGILEAGVAPDGWHSAQWILEPVPGLADAYRLRNRHRQDQYLNIEGMVLSSSSVPADYWSSYWSFTKVQ